MTFGSFEFLALLPLVVALYQLCPLKLRVPVLLFLSYAFYCTWNPRAAVVLAAITWLTYLAGKRISAQPEKRRSEVFFFISVALMTSYLFFFKIAAVAPLGRLGRIALPLGVSYYTFKLLSYIIDVYWGSLEPSPHFIPFATAVAFFPQIVAGPIQRPASFLEQVPPEQTSVGSGLARLVWGLAKKVLVADNLAPTVVYLYSHIRQLHGIQLVAAFYLFPLQLYADFSALTDIALGLGLMFGIRGPENFNRPFTATSVSDYWRRWHMSLTHWLADYLFTPLRLTLRGLGTLGLIISITVNMLAIALWHGLTWGCLAFGLVNAAYIVVDALSIRRRAGFFKQHPNLDGMGSWIGWLLTCQLIAAGLVLFRANTLSDGFWLLLHLGGGLTGMRSGLGELASAVGARTFALGLAGYAVLELAERFRPDQWWLRAESQCPPWLQWSIRTAIAVIIIGGLFVLTVRAGGKQTPFLYQVF